MSPIKKAYILNINTPLSLEYSNDCIKSCEAIKLPYECFQGIENKTAYDAWAQSGLNVKTLGVYRNHKIDKAACATVSHALIWKKIAENKETAIILEHDAIMLHPINEIPDEKIVVLGYKLENISHYNYKEAGPPKEFIHISGHEGAHAYAITWRTAEKMLEELKTIGVSTPVDNRFFLNMRTSKIPLVIASPTPAIGWIRQSTIWDKSSILNYEFIDSFKKHLI